MEKQGTLIRLASLLCLLIVGVCGECISNDNDNLLNTILKKQDKLQDKIQELQLENNAKIQNLELAALKEKLYLQEEINKLKNERTEEILTLLTNKIPDYLIKLNNESLLVSIFLSLVGGFNKHPNYEDGEIISNKGEIKEQNRLNEIQTTVNDLGTEFDDFKASGEDDEERALLNNSSSTSHKDFDQVWFVVQSLQQKVQELTASVLQLQLSGRDRDSSGELLHRRNNFTFVAKPRYCHDYYIQGERRDGVYRIHPGWNNTRSTRVWCEFDVGAEVGWTVILARMPSENPVNFSVAWDNYKAGIGDAAGEYWIGLSIMHEISISHCSQVLQVNLQSWDQASRYAQYKDFSIGDEESGYKLTIGGYSGDAVDGMAYHNGKKFTTIDKDNDANSGKCAGADRGGFWYVSCYKTNPFSQLRKKGDGEGIRWNKWLNGVNLKKITWKIAPRLPQFV